LVQTTEGEARLLAAGCPLDQVEPYGDCLTYGPGHYETWDHWRRDKTINPALVNNAGVFLSKPFVEYSESDLATAIGINLAGSFRRAQRAAAAMLREGNGHSARIAATAAAARDLSTIQLSRKSSAVAPWPPPQGWQARRYSFLA
jgi:NAD(P)-dependent dehydrogenase (short-subunit alcohol dehydrogenase family)